MSRGVPERGISPLPSTHQLAAPQHLAVHLGQAHLAVEAGGSRARLRALLPPRPALPSIFGGMQRPQGLPQKQSKNPNPVSNTATRRENKWLWEKGTGTGQGRTEGALDAGGGRRSHPHPSRETGLCWGNKGAACQQRYLFPSPARRSRVLLAWMCQRDSEVATCRTMTLMESRWMEKSWW